MQRRWDGGEVDVADIFLFHQRHTMLSVQARVFIYRTPNNSAMHAWWNNLTSSSRLLFATFKTMDAKIYMVKWSLNTIGCNTVGLGIFWRLQCQSYWWMWILISTWNLNWIHYIHLQKWNLNLNLKLKLNTLQTLHKLNTLHTVQSKIPPNNLPRNL